MTKEQAIERLKKLDYLLDDVYSTGLVEDEERNIYQDAIETVLSMLEEQDKIIDLMAEFIEDELTVDEFCTKEGCYADNYIDGHCEKCLNCIKQYFENKAKELLNK